MSIKEMHQCFETPKHYQVVKTPMNGWVIAAADDCYCFQTVVTKIKVCPFCAERLGGEND